MVNPLRTRKRVHAIRRASDGSAFEKCDYCGAMVPIALADMHECKAKAKKKVKRFKGVCEKPSVLKEGSYCDLVRSPFVFFMETFVKTCKSGKWIDIDRKGFESWKNMSKEEKQPYVVQAEKLDAAHQRALVEELTSMRETISLLRLLFSEEKLMRILSQLSYSQVDDEADSAMVGKYDKVYDFKFYFDYEDSEYSDSLGFVSFNTYEWEMAQAWIVDNPVLDDSFH